MDYLIFQLLAFVGMLAGLICGGYQITVSPKYSGDKVARTNLLILGVVDIFAGMWIVLLL
jgi:hypothetical protein